MVPAATLKLADDTTRPVTRRTTFNAKALEGIQPPAEGDLTVWDTRQAGLCLRVRASGAKALYLRRKFRGRVVRVKLGDFPDTTIEQARKGAIAAIQKMNDGIDPAAERRTERGELTIGELWGIYKATHLQPRCSPRTLHQDEWLWNAHLAPIKSRRLSDMTQAAAKALHVKIAASSKICANRSLQLLKRLYRFAARHHGYEGRIPTAAVEMFREQSRERFLSTDELPRFIAAAEAEGQPWADFFKLCLFIGARRTNTQSMKWCDVNLTAGTWTIPAEQAKSKRTMTLPLATPALEILKRRKAEQEEAAAKAAPPEKPGEYVFPPLRDKGNTLHLSQPARPFDRICKRAKIEGLTIHDLRRTAGAWLAASGASLPLIGKMLGHNDHRSTAIYARLDLSPVRVAMESVASAMAKGGAAK